MEVVMGKPISIGQSHNLMSVLANNADWEKIDTEVAQQIIDDPRRAGLNFTEFLKRLGVLPRALKSLKLIEDGIAVVGEVFKKSSFFTADGSVKLWFGDNFKKWILSAIPDSIPAFQGKLLKNQLTEYMYDSAILKELGQPNPFTVGEFAAIIRDLLSKQPKGEGGTLVVNNYTNIFYVQLEDGRVVAVSVRWDADDREWRLGASDLDDVRWAGGHDVFARS